MSGELHTTNARFSNTKVGSATLTQQRDKDTFPPQRGLLGIVMQRTTTRPLHNARAVAFHPTIRERSLFQAHSVTVLTLNTKRTGTADLTNRDHALVNGMTPVGRDPVPMAPQLQRSGL